MKRFTIQSQNRLDRGDLVSQELHPTNIGFRRWVAVYPLSLQTNTSWTRDNTTNNFLYNQGSELNTTTAWYDLFFRNYDPTLGRFVQVDPLASSSSSISSYSYSANNPIMFNDQLGDTYRQAFGNEDDGGGDDRGYDFSDFDGGVDADGNPIVILDGSAPKHGGNSAENTAHWKAVSDYGEALLSYAGQTERPFSDATNYEVERSARDGDPEAMAEYIRRNGTELGYTVVRYTPLGGEETTREEYLRNGGDPNKSADHYFYDSWEVVGGSYHTFSVLHSPFDSYDFDLFLETFQSGNYYTQTAVMITYHTGDMFTEKYGKMVRMEGRTRSFIMDAGGLNKFQELPYNPSNFMLDMIEGSKQYHCRCLDETGTMLQILEKYWDFISSPNPEKKHYETGNGVTR